MNLHRHVFVVSLLALVCVFTFAPGVSAAPRGNEIEVPAGGNVVLELRNPLERVVLGDSQVARVRVITSREIMVRGKKSGRSALHVWTEAGRIRYELKVQRDSRAGGKDLLGSLAPGDTGVEPREYSPSHRDVAEFADYISELIGNEGEVILADPESRKIFVRGPVELLDRVEDLIDRLDVPGEQAMYSRRIKLKHRPVTEIVNKADTMLTDKGQVIVDEETNSLLIVDQVDKVKQLVDYIKAVDVETVSQVRIEARFVEMSEAAEQQIGINWSYDGSVGGEAGGAEFAGGAEEGFSGVELGLGAAAPAELSARLQMLESEGLVNLISSPNVMTRNQQEANLEIINEQSFISGWNVSQTDGGGLNVTPDIDSVEGGITLTVTPLITENDIVQMDLKTLMRIVNLGDPYTQAAGGNKFPFFTPEVDRRLSELNIALRDGQTLVIGGLNRERTDSTDNNVPMLGKIPLLGPLLFGYQRDEQEFRRITIFLTAEIVDLSGDVQATADYSADSAVDMMDTRPLKNRVTPDTTP